MSNVSNSNILCFECERVWRLWNDCYTLLQRHNILPLIKVGNKIGCYVRVSLLEINVFVIFQYEEKILLFKNPFPITVKFTVKSNVST